MLVVINLIVKMTPEKLLTAVEKNPRNFRKKIRPLWRLFSVFEKSYTKEDMEWRRCFEASDGIGSTSTPIKSTQETWLANRFLENLCFMMRTKPREIGSWRHLRKFSSKLELWKALKDAAASLPPAQIRKLTQSINDQARGTYVGIYVADCVDKMDFLRYLHLIHVSPVRSLY